jgi:hypothetical protein
MKRPLAAICALTLPAPAAVLMQVPGGYYRSASDSPYFAQLRAGTAFLNNFSQDQDHYHWVNESGQMVRTEYNNEQLSVVDSTRWEFAQRVFNRAHEPGAENVSVDADDGLLDGWSDGHWGLTGDGLQSTPSMDIYFTTTNGVTTYPLWVGFVMTISGPATSGGQPYPAPRVDLLGVGDNILGSFSLFDVRADMLAASVIGGPAQIQRVFNDRSVFFHSDEPITRVKIYNETYFDHLQWGYTTVYMPEPGSASAALLALAAVVLRRGRRE